MCGEGNYVSKWLRDSNKNTHTSSNNKMGTHAIIPLKGQLLITNCSPLKSMPIAAPKSDGEPKPLPMEAAS
jgi:hypothetical protein